jgi:hypothetical protein
MSARARAPTGSGDVVPYPPPPEPCEGPAPSILEIPPGDAYIREFRSLLEPEDALRKHGYTFSQLTDEDMHPKRKCSRCNQSKCNLKILNISITCKSIAKLTVAIKQLTKGLQRALTQRSQQLSTDSPGTPLKMIPSMIIPYEDGSTEVQYCTVECLYHSARVDRATKVSVV